MFILRGCLHGGRKIEAPGKSYKEDHPRTIFFLYSVYMQKVVPIPSTRVFLDERQEDPSTRDKPDKNGS